MNLRQIFSLVIISLICISGNAQDFSKVEFEKLITGMFDSYMDEAAEKFDAADLEVIKDIQLEFDYSENLSNTVHSVRNETSCVLRISPLYIRRLQQLNDLSLISTICQSSNLDQIRSLYSSNNWLFYHEDIDIALGDLISSCQFSEQDNDDRITIFNDILKFIFFHEVYHITQNHSKQQIELFKLSSRETIKNKLKDFEVNADLFALDCILKYSDRFSILTLAMIYESYRIGNSLGKHVSSHFGIDQIERELSVYSNFSNRIDSTITENKEVIELIEILTKNIKEERERHYGLQYRSFDPSDFSVVFDSLHYNSQIDYLKEYIRKLQILPEPKDIESIIESLIKRLNRSIEMDFSDYAKLTIDLHDQIWGWMPDYDVVLQECITMDVKGYNINECCFLLGYIYELKLGNIEAAKKFFLLGEEKGSGLHIPKSFWRSNIKRLVDE